jgi:hypothetical protein
VIVSFSGKRFNHTYDHVFGVATYWKEEKPWIIDGFSLAESEAITVHAWCDLDPYSGD